MKFWRMKETKRMAIQDLKETLFLDRESAKNVICIYVEPPIPGCRARRPNGGTMVGQPSAPGSVPVEPRVHAR